MATKQQFEIVCSRKLIRSSAEIAEHICQIKRRSDGNFSSNALTIFSSLVAIVFEGLMLWGSKCHQNNSPVVCDGYVKNGEAEIDRLAAILKKKITAAVAADGVKYSKHNLVNN